jgi:hypothetical protein
MVSPTNKMGWVWLFIFCKKLDLTGTR